MNVIRQIKPTARLTNLEPLAVFVLCYLMQNVEVNDEEELETIDTDDLPMLLKITETDATRVMGDLVEMGCIKETDRKGYYVVGHKPANKKTVFLYMNDDVAEGSSMFGDTVNVVKEYINEYRKSAGKRKEGVITTIEEYFEKIWVKKDITKNDLVEIYKVLYQLVFQDYPRELTGEEVGKISHLHKFYGGVVAVRMLVEYVTNSELYGTYVNPGILLKKKDSIHAKVTGKKAVKPKGLTSEKLRGTREEILS